MNRFTPRNHNFKVDPLGVKRKLESLGIRYHEIATRAGVSYFFVCHVLSGRKTSSVVERAVYELLGESARQKHGPISQN